MLSLFIRGFLLLAGGYFVLKFFGASPSTKNRDDHNVSNPMDESVVPLTQQIIFNKFLHHHNV